MKKQIFILATTYITVAFISCSKEKTETQQTSSSMETAMAMSSQKPANPSTANLNKNLEGLFEFNGKFSEKNGKLPYVYLSTDGADIYTNDRNDAANNAIKFNGRYYMGIPNVPHSPKMSVAAWVRYDSASALPSAFVVSASDGPSFMQAFNQYYGYNNPAGNPWIASGVIDNKWHHLVVTIDGTFLKFYVDGNFIGSKLSPDVYAQALAYYVIGAGNSVGENWHGALDDLRFYSRILSASDVQGLYNL